MTIDYKAIENKIKEQFLRIINAADSPYTDYNIIISNEQQFIEEYDKDANNIYVVLKFGSSSLLYEIAAVPISFNVLSEENHLYVAQSLMQEYAEKYNLVLNDDYSIQQTYEAPSVSSNFDEVFEGFRSLISMNGVFVLMGNSRYCKISFVYTNDDGQEVEEPIPYAQSVHSYNGDVDSQVFYNNNNFVRTIVKSGSSALSLTTFNLKKVEFIKNVLGIVTKKSNVNREFKIKIDYGDGFDMTQIFRLISFNSQNAVGQLSVVSMTLSI